MQLMTGYIMDAERYREQPPKRNADRPTVCLAGRSADVLKVGR
jgi:hypothetical protein